MNTRPIGVALLVPILVAIAFSFTRFGLETFDVPSDEDYAAARRVLDDEGFDRARDAVVILPPWSLRPLAAFGDLDPISGDDIAHRPLHRWARLWAIVEPDADKELDPLVERRGLPAWARRVGRVTIERFDLPEPSVVYDLRAHLDDAVVRVVDGGGEAQPCAARVRGGVACAGKPAWQRVTREWLLVSENADDVVWSHPPPRGQRLEISWKDVPIGSGVVVQAGFTREGADAAKAAVRVKVLVDGEVVGTVTRKPQALGGTFSFYADVVDTKSFSGRTATVTLAIDSDDNASAHFAWDATVVR